MNEVDTRETKLSDETQFTESGSSPPRKPKSPTLTKHQRKGESRETVLDHAETGLAARLVTVGTGGVDRQTGAPLRTYFEVTAKLPRQAEVTRTFSGERNARIAYLMAQHGVVDFTTAVGDIGPRLWAEPRNLTALAKLPDERAEVPARTRINSGDSHADSASEPGAAISPLPRRPGLFRDVPVEELEAEDASVLFAEVLALVQP